jgi:hypothetical protein
MRSDAPETPTSRRAVRSLWILVGVAVMASGSLSAALTTRAGAVTGMRVAMSGLILLISVVLAARVLFALERARRARHE